MQHHAINLALRESEVVGVTGLAGSGLAELSRVSTARKALIVIGDGNDTNNEAAKGQLADLKKQANAQHIQMFAIIYKSAVSSEGSVITTMIGNAKTVNSIDGIASELNAIIARMADRYYLEFPGYDPATGVVSAALPHFSSYVSGSALDGLVALLVPQIASWIASLPPTFPARMSSIPWLMNFPLLNFLRR